MYANCISTTKVQSPIDITNIAVAANGTQKAYTADNWALWSYSFLPDYVPAVASLYGYNNWVYTINGTFGGIYAAEPTKSLTNRQIYWQGTQIRFHVHSEHTFNSTYYDLEM